MAEQCTALNLNTGEVSGPRELCHTEKKHSCSLHNYAIEILEILHYNARSLSFIISLVRTGENVVTMNFEDNDGQR